MKTHTYIFSILSLAIISLAAFTLTAFAGAEPNNDNFAAAEALVLNNGAFVGTRNNIGATEEAGEPNHAENIGGRSVWFSITPNVTQVYRITTTNASTNFDTLLAVYQGGAMASLTRVGYNDDCYAAG